MRGAVVVGYASRPDAVLAEHQNAWRSVVSFDREKAIIARADVHNRQRFRLDHGMTWHLTPLEKLVLAYGGPAPFGGSVNGVWVDVFLE